jgi:hypothetical protein
VTTRATGNISSTPEFLMNPRRATARIPMFVLALCNLLVVAPACAAQAHDARRAARHFDLINATFDSVTALAIAPAGSDAFHDIVLGEPLQGGRSSMTFDVPAGGCLRDLRVTFRNQRSLLYPHLDVCRYDGLRLKPQDEGRNKARDDRHPVAHTGP